MVKALDSRLNRSQARVPVHRPLRCHVTAVDKLFAQGKRKFWRRTGQAMRHRLQWFIHVRTHGLRKKDELLIILPTLLMGYATTSGSVAEWLECWTQAQKGPGSNRSRDTVG